jgi:hypothetical protein
MSNKELFILLTARELAKRLGPKVSFSSLYRMAARGLIPSVPWGAKGGGRRFIEEDVVAALRKSEKVLRPHHPPKLKRKGKNTA